MQDVRRVKTLMPRHEAVRVWRGEVHVYVCTGQGPFSFGHEVSGHVPRPQTYKPEVVKLLMRQGLGASEPKPQTSSV